MKNHSVLWSLYMQLCGIILFGLGIVVLISVAIDSRVIPAFLQNILIMLGAIMTLHGTKLYYKEVGFP